MVHCQTSGNGVRSSGVSSVLSERSMLASKDHSAGSLVLSPNGKDLVPYGPPSPSTTPFVEMNDGIGIDEFLRGKSFLITGATGFLAKGGSTHLLSFSAQIGGFFFFFFFFAKSKF